MSPRSYREYEIILFRPYLLLLVFALPDISIAAVRGGYTACGLNGEYFSNPDMKAPTSFERRDDRLNFDWGTKLPVGGSNSPSLRSFPHDHFSVRWTGKLVPRFSEKYTFIAEAYGDLRLWINNNLLIDQWSKDSQGDSAQLNSKIISCTSLLISLEYGKSYDCKVEYRQDTGPAKLILKWSSPSTPEEVIEPLSVNGFNASLCVTALFADNVKYNTMSEQNGELYSWYELVGDTSRFLDAKPLGLPSSDLNNAGGQKGRYFLVRTLLLLCQL
jgi:hypothetical protein